ncbi:eCIS core domain-containing protein [Pseudomonas japonica]|uniref:eCIS core domain-containing protein n=1 Tax=Pseudomonas japonica TaxID=256466 RepID=UPI0015E3C80D|nr:DUF4157 domain-containing protein [Pseudomonas japonica]MBA1289179.1 DUF4157 domain-containing protein [Pseudomonas japonica]
MRNIHLLPLSLTLLLLSTFANAGGLLGDLINNVAPGAGTALDDIHRDIKNNIEPYKVLEETGSRTVNEALVQAAAPALQAAIAASRDDALASGVQPIPPEIRANLEGYIPANILDMVRYRVRGGGDLSLQVNAIRYGDAEAITLDYVVVFKDQQAALYNPSLWAHELTHVQQYQSWGIHDFAVRYARNSGDVEKVAYDAQTQYAVWVVARNAQQGSGTASTSPAIIDHPVASFSNMRPSNRCGTPLGACQVNGSAPVGTSCWCASDVGPAFGSLIPSGNLLPIGGGNTPAKLPVGTVMQGCGCWGPNPNAQVQEPRCAGGGVQLQVCGGFCAPGHPLYGYTCM